MKNTFKKSISKLLAVAMSLSALSVNFAAISGSVIGASANCSGSGGSITYTYEYYAEIAGEQAPITKVDSSSGVTVWAGGGKSTLASGAIVDGKVAQLQLYAVESGGGSSGYYNITTAKTTLWGLFEKIDGGKVDSYKLTSNADKKYAKISKGKITAGKEGGTVYAQAYAGVDKKAETSGSSGGIVKVEVKQAATNIFVMNPEDSSGAIKSIAAPLGQPVVIYPKAAPKKSGDAAFSPDNTFTITVEKKAKDPLFAEISLTSSGVFSDTLTNVNSDDFKAGIWIKGKALNKEKIAKASIVITNNQSGKKVKFTANVDNSVVGVSSSGFSSSGWISVKATSSGANKGEKVEKSLMLYEKGKASFITLASDSSGCTDKPKVFVVDFKDKSYSDFVAGSYVDEKGKIKKQDTSKNVSAKIKDHKLDVTVKDNKTAAGRHLVVVVYNTNKNEAGDYPGILGVVVDVDEKYTS